MGGFVEANSFWSPFLVFCYAASSVMGYVLERFACRERWARCASRLPHTSGVQ